MSFKSKLCGKKKVETMINKSLYKTNLIKLRLTS